VIAFVVTSAGELTDFQVINSVSSAIDVEMVRLLKATSGNWMPGFINGEPGAMKKEVSLVFIPYDNYDIVKEAKYYMDKGNNLLYVKKNPKRAMKCFNEAFRLRPSNESILAARSICKFELGDEQGAIQDCNRIIALNSYDGIQLDAADPIELLEQLITGYTVNPIANK
jgi:tetratricopeptide (TPR) repeat protein